MYVGPTDWVSVDIERGIAAMGAKAKANKIEMSDMVSSHLLYVCVCVCVCVCVWYCLWLIASCSYSQEFSVHVSRVVHPFTVLVTCQLADLFLSQTGGTFSITNGGVFGSLISTPILSQPQSAILGMHGIFKRPIAVDGQIEVQPELAWVLLSCVHVLGATNDVHCINLRSSSDWWPWGCHIP